jgi:hypothetical protein
LIDLPCDQQVKQTHGTLSRALLLPTGALGAKDAAEVLMNVHALALALLALGCGKPEDTSSATIGSPAPTEPSEPEPYDATYDGGQYQVSAFAAYTLDEEGMDLDGDGTNDNATPNALLLVDPFVADADMSVDGLNQTVSDAIAKGLMILLTEAAYDGEALTVDVLTGAPGKGGATPDPVSYDDDGTPLGRLTVYFTAGDEIYATADRVQVAITFFPEEPPLPLPIEQVTMVGVLDDGVMDVDIFGVIPADDLTELLILPLLEDAYPDPEERQTYIDLVTEVLQYETVTDIELDEERRGVSCAFHLTAASAAW